MSEPFTGFEQVSLKVEAAEKMVGYATVTMDPEQLQHAATAVSEARTQFEKMKSVATDLDEPFLQKQEERLVTIEHQLIEANE